MHVGAFAVQAKGKREPGVNPGRSGHCEWEAAYQEIATWVALGWGCGVGTNSFTDGVKFWKTAKLMRLSDTPGRR
jgi:hypothetical protein